MNTGIKTDADHVEEAAERAIRADARRLDMRGELTPDLARLKSQFARQVDLDNLKARTSMEAIVKLGVRKFDGIAKPKDLDHRIGLQALKAVRGPSLPAMSAAFHEQLRSAPPVAREATSTTPCPHCGKPIELKAGE